MSNRFMNPNIQFFDSSGNPLEGGLLYFYVTGTDTPASTFSDALLQVANENPVELNEAGRAGPIFLDPSVTYKVVLKSALDVEIWSADPVSDPAANVTAAISIVAGNPNGVLAGNAGSVGGSSASMVWDATNDLLYVCTTTGDAASAVWTQVAANLAGAIVAGGVISPLSIGTSQNDYAPTGLGSAARLRQDASASVSITGLAAQATGTRICLENISSSFTITLLPNNASSSAANRFLFPRPIVLRPGQCVELEYDGTSTGWRSMSPLVSMPAAGGFKNLVVRVTSSTAVDVDADAITLEDTSGDVYRAAAVNLTASIASTGANGRDTGSEAADTFYAVWVIYNPTTDTVAALLSTSATAPTMPSGYTYKARVGWVRNDGSSNLYRTLQKGNRAQYIVGTNPAATINMATGTSGSISSPTWTAIATGAYVPTTAAAIIGFAYLNVQGDADDTLILAPNNSYGGAGAGTTNPPPFKLHHDSDSAGDTSGFAVGFNFMLESTNIYYASNDAASGVAVLGWEDNL